MRVSRQVAVVPLLALLVSSCATKLPPDSTFSPDRWAAVEALKPGAWVQVRYVYGSPPLRYTFEGTLRAVGPDVLEIETDHAVQRLLPQRVLRVATVPRRRAHPLAATILGGIAGAMAGGVWAAISERNDADTKTSTISGGISVGLLGLALGLAERGPRRVIYSRTGPS